MRTRGDGSRQIRMDMVIINDYVRAFDKEKSKALFFRPLFRMEKCKKMLSIFTVATCEG